METIWEAQCHCGMIVEAVSPTLALSAMVVHWAEENANPNHWHSTPVVAVKERHVEKGYPHSPSIMWTRIGLDASAFAKGGKK